LHIATCANPEAEATLAAREIRLHIRGGGRYRDVTVLVRNLEDYHLPLQRVFARYEIPFFLDRRESVSHHPLAELTRSALRTVVSQWQHEDWFAALKSGLVPANEDEIDRLENEALARGWKGAVWQRPVVLSDDLETTQWLAKLHGHIVPPFQRLALTLATRQNKPTGPQLAEALREFWDALHIKERLEEWASVKISGTEFQAPNTVHAKVWDQMNAWLENVELAFATEALSLREWLPILDAGLANLTVGLIPPALDQVLIGAIDRSRNPDIKLALVLGMNEGVFPAPPSGNALLTDTDRQELEQRNINIGSTARQQLARERFHGYLTCTRARERLVLSHALHDANGSPLNPSPFLSHVQQLFSSLRSESVSLTLDWRESEHISELVGPLLKAVGARGIAGEPAGTESSFSPPELLDSLPVLAPLLESLRNFHTPKGEDALSTGLARRLYGPVLRTSVSRIEQFAACPFKFFVHSGLRAEERKRFELDAREQGNFQHDALAFFHEELRRESKLWRDISPGEARERIKRVCEGLMFSYREGLMQASDQTRFTARVLSESLQNFVEVLVGWMHTQYLFDPAKVELPFGQNADAPAWSIELAPASQAGPALRLELQGRIDRIDLFRDPSRPDRARVVVVDYKSSTKKLDPVLMEHGLQLQLLAYLNVLRHWPEPGTLFGAEQLIPSGVFYVNLHGQYERARNRRAALENTAQTRKQAYRHMGRFDANVVRLLDARTGGEPCDQFNFRFTNGGQIHRGSREALATEKFEALLDSVEKNLKQMGEAIFSGLAKVDPFRKGGMTACNQCEYRAICRLDPWTHNFRSLTQGGRA
jgi:ATP-dependent helicase/nuclease subunit B